VSGESHYFLGRRYRLSVTERSGSPEVTIRSSRMIDLFVRAGSDSATRERVFQAWYRRELRSRAAPLIERWTQAMDTPLPLWGIKRMKTKWGACNIRAHRIWLNLELMKKPPQCIEYIIVHELVHFLERHHSRAAKRPPAAPPRRSPPPVRQPVRVRSADRRQDAGS
jgi:predicted metal-dependent hydrolase